MKIYQVILIVIGIIILQGCESQEEFVLRKDIENKFISKEIINGYEYNIICNQYGIAYYVPLYSSSYHSVLTPVIDSNGFVSCDKLNIRK